MREEFHLFVAPSFTHALGCDISTLSCKSLRQSEIKATYWMALLAGWMPGTKGASVLFIWCLCTQETIFPRPQQGGERIS